MRAGTAAASTWPSAPFAASNNPVALLLQDQRRPPSRFRGFVRDAFPSSRLCRPGLRPLFRTCKHLPSSFRSSSSPRSGRSSTSDWSIRRYPRGNDVLLRPPSYTGQHQGIAVARIRPIRKMFTRRSNAGCVTAAAFAGSMSSATMGTASFVKWPTYSEKSGRAYGIIAAPRARLQDPARR